MDFTWNRTPGGNFIIQFDSGTSRVAGGPECQLILEVERLRREVERISAAYTARVTTDSKS